MPQLIINLTDEEHAPLLKKAGSHDLEKITRIALDKFFQTRRFIEENTPALDLSGRGKAIAALEADRIDLNRPQPPDRNERRSDNNRLRYETAEDFEKAMASYRWRLDLYTSEKATFEAKKRNGTINAFGGVSCVL